jgi:hypothetical protein
MEGKLYIENWTIKIGVIQIQPILNTHLIEEELSLLLEIYKEEDNDNFELIAYFLNLSHIKMPKEMYLKNSFNGKFEFSETAIGLNEIWYYGDEYRVKELQLNFITTSGKKTLIGNGKAVNDEQKINFKFNGKFEINELETWRLSEEEKRERQAKIDENLIAILERLISKEDCQSYKNTMPFVHIPYKLMAQWDSWYQTKYKWFDEYYIPSGIRFIDQR